MPDGTFERGTRTLDVRTLDIGTELVVTDLRKSFSVSDRRTNRGPARRLVFRQRRVRASRSWEPRAPANQPCCICSADSKRRITAASSPASLRWNVPVQSALARFRNNQVGFVFQFHHLLPDLTAAENVSLPLLIRRIHPREAARHALQALARDRAGESRFTPGGKSFGRRATASCSLSRA